MSRKAKTPAASEKGRTPRASSQGGISDYFDPAAGGPSEAGAKTPTARTPAGLTMSKGKNREGSVADTVASPVNGVQSDSSDAGTARNSVIGSPRRASAVSIEQELQTVDDNEHALTTDSESQGESHDSDSSSEGTSSDSHHHASSPAANGLDDPDESFVVVAPPTPGARVPAASQESFRPNLYHQASRSLINLSGPSDRRLDSEPSFRSKLRESLSKLELPPAAPPTTTASNPKTPTAIPERLILRDMPPKASSAEALTSPEPPSSPPPPLSPLIETKRPRRRNSMSDLHAPPPEYTPPGPGSNIPRPRDEEGKERLPQYSCSVHIEGYMPRKTEFTSPGVQARDRAWKRQYFGQCGDIFLTSRPMLTSSHVLHPVLHGTCLKVYKHDLRRYPVRQPNGQDYSGDSLRHVAQGAPHVHFPGVQAPEVKPPLTLASAAGSRRASDASGRGSAAGRGSDASARRASISARRPSDPPATTASAGIRRGSVVDTSVRSTSVSASSLPSSNAVSRSSSVDITASPVTTTPSPSISSVPETLKTPFGSGEGVVHVPRSSSVSSGHGPKEAIAAHLPFHGQNQLVKSYSLQNAESGLAADYIKKKNVVRVRLQGEQFLIETGSPKEVVDWIEAFQVRFLLGALVVLHTLS